MGAARNQSQLLGEERKELLDRLANECLEHTKQLGLFDQLRMRLLDSIVASNEFQKIKNEFRRELDTFCSQADLSESRSKLRERLTTKTLPKSAIRLKELVLDKLTSSRRQRHEMRQLYTEQALNYIRGACLANQNKQENHEVEMEESNENTSNKIDEQPPSSGSSSDSLATDSGVSSSGCGSSCSPPTTTPATNAPPTTAPSSPIPAKILLRNYHIPKLEKRPIDSPVEAKKPSPQPPPATGTTTITSSNPFCQQKPASGCGSSGGSGDRWRRSKKKKNKSRRQRTRVVEERRDARTSRPARSRSPQRPRPTSSSCSSRHITTTQRGPIKVT